MSDTENGGFAPLDDDGDRATDAAAEGADSDGSPVDALLETKPDLRPEEEAEQLGTSLAGGHAYTGVRKVLNGLAGIRGASSGTPAIVNFGFAGYYSFFEGGNSGGTDLDDESGDFEEWQ